MSSKKLRLKLNDFINGKHETDVIYFLGFILQSINPDDLNVQFWYENGSLKKDELTKFKKVYNIFLDRYEIDIYERHGHLPRVWYDILNNKDVDEIKNHRFSSTYETVEELITCLAEFNSFYRTSLTFNSRTKYQKKDGKNKNSSNRKHSMAKSNENKGNTIQDKK